MARYAEAIQACYDLDTEVWVQEWDERVAHAVTAAYDQETAELRAEAVLGERPSNRREAQR